MNEFKYTPGSWSQDKYGSIVDRNGESVRFRGVTTLCSGSEQAIAEAEANTTLAAAAPELLEALQSSKSLMESIGMQSSDEYQQASAAIAKALGEE